MLQHTWPYLNATKSFLQWIHKVFLNDGLRFLIESTCVGKFILLFVLNKAEIIVVIKCIWWFCKNFVLLPLNLFYVIVIVPVTINMVIYLFNIKVKFLGYLIFILLNKCLNIAVTIMSRTTNFKK
jgi:hypothetical protein